jgi:hypothetical protein
LCCCIFRTLTDKLTKGIGIVTPPPQVKLEHMPNVEHSFVLYALLLEPGGCLRAHITLFELVEPEKKKKSIVTPPPSFNAGRGFCNREGRSEHRAHIGCMQRKQLVVNPARPSDGCSNYTVPVS